jgi:hypothetical protein
MEVKDLVQNIVYVRVFALEIPEITQFNRAGELTSFIRLMLGLRT